MKIEIKNHNPYQSLIDVVRELTKDENGYEFIRTYILLIKTGTLGEDTIIMTPDGDDYRFDYDWWEGGDVELLCIMPFDDVVVPRNIK